jgi:hypothetical protein
VTQRDTREPNPLQSFRLIHVLEMPGRDQPGMDNCIRGPTQTPLQPDPHHETQSNGPFGSASRSRGIVPLLQLGFNLSSGAIATPAEHSTAASNSVRTYACLAGLDTISHKALCSFPIFLLGSARLEPCVLANNNGHAWQFLPSPLVNPCKSEGDRAHRLRGVAYFIACVGSVKRNVAP